MKIFILLTILTLITACAVEPVNFENHIQNPHPVDRSK
jgi:hypothetical protein|tara:strand:+ start:305 stop:418 length:114 start_codon:yes stop_codon:yes gene_type:complete